MQSGVRILYRKQQWVGRCRVFGAGLIWKVNKGYGDKIGDRGIAHKGEDDQ